MKRSLRQTELARTYPRPVERQVPKPKHDLLHQVFARSELFRWLNARTLDFVIRVKKGTWLTEASGKRRKVGVDLPFKPGEQLWFEHVRYALYHDRPTDIRLNVVCSWCPSQSLATRKPSAQPGEAWYLATNLSGMTLTIAWYRRRFWIEDSSRDDKSRLLLDDVRVESTPRLSRLLMALTIAVCWLCLIADPKTGVLPPNWNASVATWGKARLVLQAPVYLDDCWTLPRVLEAT